MLQPRLLVVLGCGSGKMGSARNTYFQSLRICFIVTAVILSSTFVSCQELNKETIDASRIKRESVPENRDLTVLLVNDKNGNDYNSKIGRYHSVKPVIGLLTSTARTFIQDGVTTEFATQILGTTLDNGRIYAQLLTKSSLVLYSKPTNIDEPLFVKPTKVPSIFDEQWNVKEDLGYIDPDKHIPKNIDYLAPSSKMKIVYASKTPQENIKYWSSPSLSEDHIENQIFEEPIARKVQSSNEILRDGQNEVLNQLDGPTVESVNNVELTVQPPLSKNENGVYRQNKAYKVVPEPVKIESQINEDVVQESNVSKVRPDYDLPTFTIKNEFSPIFYYIDNVESQRVQQVAEPTKLPKKLFGQNTEPRAKTTFTYAGFADFTTVVGDTVIIFTPNTETAQQPSPNEVNIFPSVKKANDLGTKITFLSADIPVATSTYKAHEVSFATQAFTSTTEKQETEKPFYVNEENAKEVKYEPGTHVLNGFAINLDVIQPSEAAITTTESTRVSDSLEILPIRENIPQPTEPLTTLDPTATNLETPKQSVVTDSKEIFTNSEEESDNVGAEVTEGAEEEEEEIISQKNEKEERETTVPIKSDLITTTESGHSEESFEDEIESTTESKFDIHEELVCSDGLETRTTMTTEYKTLTYLTTYFIPLESTETTTSVKSDVVVESNIGYLTNVLCKSDYDIQPTEILSVNIQPTEVLTVNIQPTEVLSVNIQPSEILSVSFQPSVSSTESQKDNVLEESLTEPSTSQEITTENISKVPETEKHVFDAVQHEHDITTIDKINSDKLDEKHPEEQPHTSTTTENAPTSQSHVEVSVSTEHSTTTEKPVTEAQEDNSQENEIDVIYKTLYTTYTYFTTFFGDQTSSVASHKVVETNVITSTIDLNNLDPSLLGVLGEEDIIAPTNVGIGRPTESFAQNSISNLFQNKFLIESVEQDEIYSSQTPTPSLGDDVMADIKPDVVKTFFTTYTFFTTIFVGTDANVCSRSEIYTNYVGPQELIPTKTLETESTLAQYDFRNCRQIKLESPENQSSLESGTLNEDNTSNTNKSVDEVKTDITPQPTPVEVDMLFSVDSNPVENENLYVTDVTSSSSKGERKFLDSNNILEDQISSESNIEEIMPSPTLLLQTSYTTFTYFTTMYIGKDSSKVKSRLETITNVVTETITPNKDPEDESTLPITYYTTFTYWTTLSKDNSTTITSREEIVSNVVTPTVQILPTVNPIDTTPIDIDNIVAAKDLEVQLKPSLIGESLDHDDGKATFYTTYTYFTTFYVGNTSQIRSSLETVTNIIDNTKSIEDNQLGRKIQSGPPEKNLLKDNEKPYISPTSVKEQIKPTKLPDISSAPPTVLLGTYIDNLFAEVKPIDNSIPTSEAPKKILFSQVAVISGDSTIVTKDNKTINNQPNTTSTTGTTTTTTTTTTTSPAPDTTTNSEKPAVTLAPEVIESSVAEPDTTTVLNQAPITEDDISNNKKKSRLTYTPKKPSYTPVIIPFASRNRPTFSPKRVPLLSSATTITRADSTPTITATPTLKSVRTSGFSTSRKQQQQPQSQSVSPAGTGRRFSGRNTVSSLSSNIPLASRSGGFSNRANIQPSSRRTGFRSSTLKSNSFDYASRSAVAAKIRPTASLRIRNSRQSASVTLPPSDPNESETTGTQLEENTTDSSDEVTEPSSVTTSSPLSRFRRPNVPRLPGTAILPRTTPPTKKGPTARLRTTTTRRITTRSINPILSLRRDRPNSLFPRRNLFKQPEPTPIEEVKEDETAAEEEELLETEEFDEDNEYDASNRKEEQVEIPSAFISRKSIYPVQIKPFRRRVKRQLDYGSRKYPSFRRPGTINTRRNDPTPEAETEKAPAPSTTKSKTGRVHSRTSKTTKAPKTTPAPAAPKVTSRQPFIVRGAQTTTTSAPAYRRNSNGRSRTTARTTTSRPKTGSSRNTSTRSGSSRSSKPRSRTTTGRTSGRTRGSFENTSGERFNFNNILNDGKVTVTHHIPLEITVPIINGKITEYKNLLTETTSIETLLRNQVSTTLGVLGNQQLIIATESTELADNGATKIIKYLLQETPTTTIIFTPTTIRGRKTSYSHVLPSTVYNVEAVTQTIAPEITANLPLANLLLSQLLLGGNQQPGINPLLALQGQSLFPQQPVAQTPVTEYITKTNTFVTTVTDARETVLPITFRGTAILTTIIDPTTSVITATEFVTDTVVTTPTVFGPAASTPQLNSLLLPLLLQQQQQQQQQPLLNLPLQTANPLLALMPELGLDPNLDNFSNDIYSNSPKPNILLDLISNEDLPGDEPLDVELEEEIPSPPPPPPPHTPAIHPSPAFLRGRARTRAAAKLPPANNPLPHAPPSPPNPPSPPAAAKITSVVTLYVSGRYPGEFSTVLSTVVSEDTQTVRKREANYYEDIQLLPSVLPTHSEIFGSQADNIIEDSILIGSEKYWDDSPAETQSLESIVGELSKHIKYDASPTHVVKLSRPSVTRDLKQSLVDDIS